VPHNALRVALLSLLAVLAIALYPTIAFDRLVAPEASLRHVAPWRLQWGPGPEPSPLALAAATGLGPRLHGLSRDGWHIALWNPWVGGGRGGWLASPAEGRAPLALLSGLLARNGSQWTALLALELGCAFLGTLWLLGRLGIEPLPSVAGAVVYTFSGAVSSTWLDWRGSAAALGPAILALLLGRDARPARRVARWAAALAIVVISGGPALAFLAIAILEDLLPRGVGARRWRAWPAVAALPLALAVVLPALWLGPAAAEPGAPPVVSSASAPLPGLEALVVPFPGGDPGAMSPSLHEPLGPGLVGAGFIGLGALILAVVGLVSGGATRRWMWLGVLLASLALALVPVRLISALGLSDRPLAALALAFAVLAGIGAGALAARIRPAWRTAASVGLAVVLAVELAPPALHRVPLATRHDAALSAPLPATAFADGSRAVALLGAMPPDIGESLGVPDVRARSLLAEPEYARRLGWREGTSVSADRALSTDLAGLGTRWILEPMPLRVMTGAIFSRIELGEATLVGSSRPGAASFHIDLPAGVTRLGLPSADGIPRAVTLACGDLEAILTPDHALAAESGDWLWYALPARWPGGESTLGTLREGAPPPPRLDVAKDRSGMRVHDEGRGVRIWESEHAARFARFLEPETGTNGESLARARVVDFAPQRLAIRADCSATETLVVQVKYRPALWRAKVDGRPVGVQPFDVIWSAIRLGPGRHDVVFAARLPAGVWLASAAGLLALACLVVMGRPR
jgi:hypothetical protein